MATAAATLTHAQSAAVARNADAAARRQLTVFGPSSYVVPEADPGTPAWCVSSQRRNGAWHLVWVQTVDGVPRLMCSCPARQSPRVFTCSHAQAVRLQLAAQCAARGSRPAAYVESPAPASPPAPSGPGLGSAVALSQPAVPFCGFCGLSGVRVCGVWRCPYVLQGLIPVDRDHWPDTTPAPAPDVPPDAVESLREWHDALDAAGPPPLPAETSREPKRDDGDAWDEWDDGDPCWFEDEDGDLVYGVPPQPHPDPANHGDDDDDALHDAIWTLQHGPDPDDDDDDPDPTPPPAAAAAAAVEPEPVPAPALAAPIVHCPRCGRAADVDALAEHGACARCIHARPELSQSARRTPAEKAETRRRIIADEEQRQRHYRRAGRDDDPRREEQRRERAAKAEARRRERRESDGNPRADHETAPLYRDNRGISPWRS